MIEHLQIIWDGSQSVSINSKTTYCWTNSSRSIQGYLWCGSGETWTSTLVLEDIADQRLARSLSKLAYDWIEPFSKWTSDWLNLQAGAKVGTRGDSQWNVRVLSSSDPASIDDKYGLDLAKKKKWIGKLILLNTNALFCWAKKKMLSFFLTLIIVGFLLIMSLFFSLSPLSASY